MRFSVLASSSKGNCIYVESDETRVLIDAGLSHRRTKNKLEEIGVDFASLDGICITHEHTDHTRGIPVMYKQHQVPLFATDGTSVAVELSAGKSFEWSVFEPGMTFKIGNLLFETFSVSHDASDPVGYVISDGKRRLGIATDMGMASDLTTYHLKGCNALILEFNHDATMLENADRPWSLKSRIMSNKGHLSNEQAYELLKGIAGKELETVFLAHLSEECNTPEIAVNYAKEALSSRGLNNTRIYWPNLTFELIKV